VNQISSPSKQGSDSATDNQLGQESFMLSVP